VGVVRLGNSIACVPHSRLSLGDQYIFACNIFHMICIRPREVYPSSLIGGRMGIGMRCIGGPFVLHVSIHFYPCGICLAPVDLSRSISTVDADQLCATHHNIQYFSHSSNIFLTSYIGQKYLEHITKYIIFHTTHPTHTRLLPYIYQKHTRSPRTPQHTIFFPIKWHTADRRIWSNAPNTHPNICYFLT